MKKMLISLLVLAATTNVFAIDYTAKARITLTGKTSSESCYMTVAQSDDSGISYYTAEMNMDYRKVAFYAYVSSTPYEVYATNDLGNLRFGMMTFTDTDYKLTISNVAGSQTLKMRDEVTGDIFDLTEGYVYNFTAPANQAAITDRFHLFVAPTSPEICHRYGKLQISGSNGQNVTINKMDDSATSIGTVAITADYQEIAVKGVLTPGQYKVLWNSQTLIIEVQ